MKSAEEIIEKLKRSFNAPSKKDEKIKVVVFCIIISTTFWFFSALNKSDYVTQISYPIEFSYDTEAYVAVGTLPRQIGVEVTGGGWDLMTRSFGFNMEPIVIELDDPSQSKFQLTSTFRGELTPRLDPVVVNFILRDSLFYNIEKKVTREIPLAFDSAGLSLAPDHRITSAVSLSPPSVRFTGPESLINALPEPYVVKADGDNYDDSMDETFDLPDWESELISANLSEVGVQLEIDEFLSYQRPVQVMRLNFEDSTLSIEPSEVEVSYTIRRSEEVYADSLDIMLIADFYTFDSTDSTVAVSVAVKAGHIRDLSLSLSRLKVSTNE